jgi:hypothetical protein
MKCIFFLAKGGLLATGYEDLTLVVFQFVVSPLDPQ